MGRPTSSRAGSNEDLLLAYAKEEARDVRVEGHLLRVPVVHFVDVVALSLEWRRDVGISSARYEASRAEHKPLTPIAAKAARVSDSTMHRAKRRTVYPKVSSSNASTNGSSRSPSQRQSALAVLTGREQLSRCRDCLSGLHEGCIRNREWRKVRQRACCGGVMSRHCDVQLMRLGMRQSPSEEDAQATRGGSIKRVDLILRLLGDVVFNPKAG